jgi:hypothetical protein
MIGDERDELIERVRQTLTPLPPADPQAVARVLSAIASDATTRPTPSVTWVTRVRTAMSRPVLSLSGAGAIAALALVIGYSARSMPLAPAPAPDIATAATTDSLDLLAPMGTGGLQPRLQVMTNDPDANAAVAVDFVFEAQAQRVSLVGDFNGWAVDSTPMQRIDAGPVWSVTVPITPGRHVYAFVIDGERWAADPHAPAAPDADFGKPGSVILVRPQ